MFSQEDLNSVVKHLRSIYPMKSIIHTDPNHLFENLKFTKTQVIMLNSEMIVILSVPITDAKDYQLYEIHSVPTINNTILVPSEKYYLQGLLPKWSSFPCIKGTQYYVCINVRVRKCNLTTPIGCDFAIVKNKVKLFELLNNEHILFFSEDLEMVLQTCPGFQKTLHISGPHIVYTNDSCSISTMGIMLEPKPTKFLFQFPFLFIQKEPILKHEIHFQTSHLDANKLKLDLQPLIPKHDVVNKLTM